MVNFSTAFCYLLHYIMRIKYMDVSSDQKGGVYMIDAI
jgi:hypothetical protein